MEVAIGANSSNTPFQREVREWQRVDPNTGALLSGRLEADRWINGPLNAYGKIVNSQNISQTNGVQQSQKNQLEVLQARTSSGSLQVVRAQTVQTTTTTGSNSRSLNHDWPSTSLRINTNDSLYQNMKAQSFDDRIFSNGGTGYQQYQYLTNGHMSASDSHNDHLVTPLNNSHKSNHNNRLLVATTPSVKLSSLMKNNTAGAVGGATNANEIINGGGRSSPHFPNNSMSLLQQRNQQQQQQQQQLQSNTEHQYQLRQQQQQHENETQSSSFTDGSRYRRSTTAVGEVRVGVGVISSNQMEPLRNERETTLDHGRKELLSLSQLHRGRSISTDDLATEWNHNDDDSDSSEWRRVSKIRRSFQFPKSTSLKTIAPSRPLDLPKNSGSVSRIRHELENGRRLNTAMRGNHVDLAALNNILNGIRETEETKVTKKATFLTAESLKEIRGKLKKLSDESLYKDDFITQNNMGETEIEGNHDLNGYSVQQPIVLQDSQVVQQQASFQYHPKLEGIYTTNSLENRTKYRDTNSAEWHLRRKSYGFEKMTSAENPMFRMETSTDSGIGRSGDLENWSPSENSTIPTNPVTVIEDKANNIQKTMVTLTNENEVGKNFERPLVQRRLHPDNDGLSVKPIEFKRHSIAVDETKYVGGENVRKAFETKSSLVHLNGFYTKDSNTSQTNISDDNGRRQKRVEFCKTEVHFAAESGKVNIVETDGKPPPTNNFRRRRRTTAGSNLNNSYLEAINSGIPLTHFGDEKKTIFEREIVQDELTDTKNNVTISIPIKNDSPERVLMHPNRTVVEIEDEVSLRSILKNKPIKPKPYHLGENVENSESLWGIRLRPIAKTAQDNPLEKNYVKTVSPVDADYKESLDPMKSVAERIKIVEERNDESGYSTKINLNLSNSPYSWEAPEFPKTNIMSIELHSPTSSTSITECVTSESIPREIKIPVPKPRTVSPVKAFRNENNIILENDHVKPIKIIQQHYEAERKPIKIIESNIKNKEPLKVVTGGARKLRDHELSYFGVKTDNNNHQQEIRVKKIVQQQRINVSSDMNSNNLYNNRTINNKKVHNNSSSNEKDGNIQKWKLSSDKPDLLRHSPAVLKRTVLQTKVSSEPEPERRKISNDDGPIYENLKKPSSYSRKNDLKRDEMILNEMTKTADQTLKSVNSCPNQSRDQDHCQSSQRRPSKPLDTIDEKTVISKSLQQQSQNSQQKKIKSKAIQVSRHHNNTSGSDSFQRPCCSNRPSSASSIESLTHYPTVNSTSFRTTTSRSRSKESSTTGGRIEYANIRPTNKLSASSSPSIQHDNNSKNRCRSQSRDRQLRQIRSHSHHSSSDDLTSNNLPRIKKLSKSRDKDGSIGKEKERKKLLTSAPVATRSKTDSNSDNHHKSHHHHHHQNSRFTSDDQIVKSKRSSRNVEKSDRISSSKSKRSSPISTSDYQHHNQQQPQQNHHSNNKSNHNQSSKSRITTTKSSLSGIVSSTYVSQPTITRMIPPLRKNRQHNLKTNNNNINNNNNNNNKNNISLRHGYSSSSFSYFPSGNFLAMRKRELQNRNNNNNNSFNNHNFNNNNNSNSNYNNHKKRLQGRRNKTLGVCICS